MVGVTRRPAHLNRQNLEKTRHYQQTVLFVQEPDANPGRGSVASTAAEIDALPFETEAAEKKGGGRVSKPPFAPAPLLTGDRGLAGS